MTTNVSEIKVLRLADIRFDRVTVLPDGTPDGYQRPLNKLKVQYLLDNFDPQMLGVFTISVRADGSLYAVDCQHRIHACIVKGYECWKCECLYGLTRAQEAALYRGLNKPGAHTATAPLNLYMAGVSAGEALHVDLDAIIRELGMPKPNAITRVLRIHQEYGPDHTRPLLTILRDWRNAYTNKEGRRAGHTLLVQAISDFIARYPEADLDRLRSVLLAKTPAYVLAKVMTRGTEGVLELRDMYNARLRTKGQLP